MTLAELLPTLRESLRSRLEPGIWPRDVQHGRDGDLLLGGVPLTQLAARFGTPSYLLDETVTLVNAEVQLARGKTWVELVPPGQGEAS